MLHNIDVGKVIDIAKEAGDAVLALLLQNDFETISNDEKVTITSADLKSNEIILNRLKELSPEIPVISEESAHEHTDENLQAYWLVDPLNGTLEFIQKRGEFTINIALIENGYPILGVVHIPSRNETFYSIRREGAFKIKEEETVRLRAKKFGFSDPGLVVVCSRNHLDFQTENFIQVLNNPQIKYQGSSLKFTEIAAGKAHIYPRFSSSRPWDTAAAQIISEEAGGRVMDMTTGKRLYYKTPRQVNNGILVTGGVQIPEAVWHRFQQF